MDEKKLIRSRLLSRRDSLATREVRELSHLIQERAVRLMNQVQRIGLYAPIRNEVQTDELFEWLQREGKEVAYPKVHGKRFEFLKVKSREQLVPGQWGIDEPSEGVKIPLKELDLIVMPGVAFDARGGRIGFGQGYYDRELVSFTGLKVGLAYDFQIVETFSHEEHDLECHYIVTEKRVINV